MEVDVEGYDFVLALFGNVLRLDHDRPLDHRFDHGKQVFIHGQRYFEISRVRYSPESRKCHKWRFVVYSLGVVHKLAVEADADSHAES